MKVYHGTSAKCVPSILQDGLLPREDTGTSNWEIESADDRVYVTTAYGPYFAMHAADAEERMALIEIDLERLAEVVDFDFAMLPDEDFLEQTSRNQDFSDQPWMSELEDAGDMRGRTAWFRENAYRFSHEWEKSLKYLGTAAIVGDVPPDAISRVSTFSADATTGNRYATLIAQDPSIFLANYAIAGEKYRALTEWFMGEEVTRQLAERIVFYGLVQLNEDSNPIAKAFRQNIEKAHKALLDRSVHVQNF